MALYLKYRPQTLDELIGQEVVKRTLSAAFNNNKLSHAYLFVGPRGTGKTSTARILAKMVNCEGENVPCNQCATCLSITDGSNLDLIEIDAASNRGIEDIRSLREKIKLAPTLSRKKVYIIDEVHMLTTEAFNALLKTLEEPPSHALFILATTDVSKVPQTILSRTQRLDFKMGTQQELKEALDKIVKQEKIDIEDEALKFLVRQASGSFRDGVKLLDQISALEGKITHSLIEENLKSSKFDDVLGLSKALAEKKANDGLMIISKQLENGADTKELILSLMDLLRNILLIKNGLGVQLVQPYFTEDKYGKLVELSNKFSGHDLVHSLNVLQESYEKLKFASISALPLELAVMEICISEKSEKQYPPVIPAHVLRSRGPQDRGAGIQLEKSSSELDPRLHGDDTKEPAISGTVNASEDMLKLKEKWTFVLETIRPFNFSLEALLRSINVTQCSETEVFMEVPYSFHQRILEAPKNRDLLESILSDILGRQIKVSIVLGGRPQRKEDIANIEVAQDDEIIRAAAEIFNSDTIN